MTFQTKRLKDRAVFRDNSDSGREAAQSDLEPSLC